MEIINDTNGEIINFYEVLQRDFAALEKEVTISLHSRKLHRQAEVIYSNPDLFDQRTKVEVLTANYPIEVKPEKRGKKELVNEDGEE